MHPFSILTLGIFVAGYITARWDLVTRLYELAIFAAEYGVVVCLLYEVSFCNSMAGDSCAALCHITDLSSLLGFFFSFFSASDSRCQRSYCLDCLVFNHIPTDCLDRAEGNVFGRSSLLSAIPGKWH